MNVWPARAGMVISPSITATPVSIQAEAVLADYGVEGVFSGALSLPAAALADFTASFTGSDFPLPAANDQTAVLDFKMNAGVYDSIIAALEFDNGGGDGEITQQTGQGGGTTPTTPVPDGFSVLLGAEGTLAAGALTLTPQESVSAALSGLNKLLGLLVPPQPPNFPNNTGLQVTNVGGYGPLLAVGVADHAGSGLQPGAGVTRVPATTINTNGFNGVGPGNAGTISATLNGAIAASHTLTGANDNGDYNGLIISGQAAYPPATPGFWTSVNISIGGLPVPVGISSVSLADSETSATNTVTFVSDLMTSGPSLSSTSLAQQSAGSLAYSSGVPHYGSGAALSVAVAISNLAGETYYSGAPLTLYGTNGIIGGQSYGYGAVGIATPIPRQTTAPVSAQNVSLLVNGSNVHAAGVVQGYATNVNGNGQTVTISPTTILVLNGSASGRIDETSVSISGLGSAPNAANAARVGLGVGGDQPAAAASPWNSAAALPTFEASVVGGVLSNDQTNYSVGYLPAGPNLSTGRNAAQYVTFAFERSALSAFKIAINGAYAGCWIKLPGVSDQAAVSPNAVNGWWNAGQAYGGAGTPGNGADPAAGCALGAVMNGGSGTFQITFGTASSTSATGNTILVRLKLNPGQSVTSLAFSN